MHIQLFNLKEVQICVAQAKKTSKKNCSDMTFLQHRCIHLTASHWTEQKFWYFAEKLRCNDWNYWENFNFTTKRNWDVMFKARKGNECHSTQSLRIRHQVFLFMKILFIKNLNYIFQELLMIRVLSDLINQNILI